MFERSFNTGESALNFENDHNEADGNLYARSAGRVPVEYSGRDGLNC
jgi:hypothetical protein